MNRTFSFITALALPLLLILSCVQEEPNVPVERISINQPTAELEIGETIQLSATVSPSNATHKEVTWSSSNVSVAPVSDVGFVTALAEGNTKIFATADGKTAECAITVSKRFVEVTSISLNKEELSMIEGDSETLVATIRPDDATDKTVSWSTSDATIVIVNNGVVKAKKAGSATITAKVGEMEATCAITVEAAFHIAFADAVAKYACVEKFDTNGDGEISIKEAEAVTSFLGLFSNWRNVKSFDEIKYFKNVHSLERVFSQCNKLVSITIPDNITDLGGGAFFDCSSLSEVTLPSSLTTITDGAFENCSSLSAINIPESVTKIGSYAFIRCYSLSEINLPSSLTTIGNSAFQDCHLLSAVSIPEGVTSIGDFAFSGINDFYIWKIELPSSITYLGNNCFSGVRCLILPSTSPVSIKSDAFADVQGIFVPSNLIDIYSSMVNWEDYSLKIHPINSYKEKEEYELATDGAVDMGTSVKWAAFNLGATKPEEYGEYYAWGETQTKNNYTWSTYKWSNGGENKLTKYCDKADYWDGLGTPDGKTILELVDDAARANWGGTWRMPTKAEFSELLERCLYEWTTYEGIDGCEFYSVESGKIIFLPVASHYSGLNYWSSSLDTDNFPSRAWYLRDEGGMYISDRSAGFAVRPVTE